MSSYFAIDLVTEPSHHLWHDALHARELARTTNDSWNVSTYVRFTVIFACIILEECCKDALESKDVARRFKENINKVIIEKGMEPIDWGQGIWQDVINLREERHYYTHINSQQERLFANLDNAEEAIQIVRNAVKDIYLRAGKAYPKWIDEDNEKGFS